VRAGAWRIALLLPRYAATHLPGTYLHALPSPSPTMPHLPHLYLYHLRYTTCGAHLARIKHLHSSRTRRAHAQSGRRWMGAIMA